MLLGLDLGTGSAKAILMASSGSVLGEGAASYPVRSPRPGWAESDTRDWWEACAEAVRAAVGKRGSSVVALGLSGQMHGVDLSDAAGNPTRPAVLWADTRSAGLLDRYRELDAGLRGRLANPLAAGMAGPSLLWLRDEEPEAYRAARWALQPKDWPRLTGQSFSEPSDASATLLYDLQAHGWTEQVIEVLDLRTDLLPPLVASGSPAGTLEREAAGFFGLRLGFQWPPALGTRRRYLARSFWSPVPCSSR
jgi:xylulokinase